MQPQHKVYVEADLVTLERVYVGGKRWWERGGSEVWKSFKGPFFLGLISGPQKHVWIEDAWRTPLRYQKVVRIKSIYDIDIAKDISTLVGKRTNVFHLIWGGEVEWTRGLRRPRRGNTQPLRPHILRELRYFITSTPDLTSEKRKLNADKVWLALRIRSTMIMRWFTYAFTSRLLFVIIMKSSWDCEPNVDLILSESMHNFPFTEK